MSKPIVLLIDTDEEYLIPLEMKFVEEYGDGINLEIITDPLYLEEYFSVARSVDVLAISEEMYFSQLKKHNIANVFILSEKEESGMTEDLSVQRILKYSGVKKIFNDIAHYSDIEMCLGEDDNIGTKVILVYSPIGGSGKTTIALGLSSYLSVNHKKVLYVDAESVQNFQYFFKDPETIPNEICREMRPKNERIYVNMKEEIRHRGFDYLPPFSAALSSLSVQSTAFVNFVKKAKESREYDYIVVDTDSVFDDLKAEFMEISDKVFLIAKQDSYSIYKMDTFLNNINHKKSDKYIFICNEYKKKIVSTSENYAINEVMEKIENYDDMTATDLFKNEAFQNIAYMII